MNKLALALFVMPLASILLAAPEAEKPFGIPQRVPWTTSRVIGSPEPPPPYRIERVFPKLTFKNPLLLRNAPGTDRLFIGEQAGKLYSFKPKPEPDKADLFLDLTTEIHSWDAKRKVKGVGNVYALAFHPQFAKNRYCYVCYVLDSNDEKVTQLPEGSRVSRFTVTDTDPPRCDPKSEKILITWLAGGHNGCDMHFGNDGFLYISTGDGTNPNPPDLFDTGQDISDLLSSILRIDVDREDPGKAYAVPPDNPFVHTAGARPEVWAYGFRNPWRMSFDRPTGDLWVGDVGWELWEMIYRVRKGGNYGWSVMEGPQTVRPDAKRGPTPILPPALAYPHTEGASITGGYVYHGKRLKELDGEYLCGDWVTRRIWATRFDRDDKVLSHRELAHGDQRIVAFSEDNTGELYFVDYDERGGIYQLVPNEAAAQKQNPFPRKLSETGLFASVKDQQPAPGVVPYSIRAAQWMDYATAERFVALPGTSTVRFYENPVPLPKGFYSSRVFFPKDGVLARTVSLELERGNPRSRRRLETQVLHFNGETWHGYTYRWNDAQTDAELVDAKGAEQTLDVIDPQSPGGKRKQTWHFPSRAECMTCHNPWSGPPLAFAPEHLDKNYDYGSVTDNQLRTLRHIEVIAPAESGEEQDPGDKAPTKLVDPYDDSANLTDRARSYLQVNCAHCHRFGAGGTADLDFRFDLPLEQTKVVGVRPVQGAFGIPDAQIICPADPYRSVLYFRMSKLGQGRMPHIGSDIIDDRGVRLIHDWIRQLPAGKDERLSLDRLCGPDEETALARERGDAPRQLRRVTLVIARANGREQPTDADRREAETRCRTQAVERAKARSEERAEAIGRLLSTTGGALRLARAVADGKVPATTRTHVVAAAVAKPEPQIRDLFERFIPDEQRARRLGTSVKPEQLLALKGDAGRGKELFFKPGILTCINCHQVRGTGNATLGPDLSEIGKKYTRAQILESILEPSKTIDPKYVAYTAEMKDGKVVTGLLGSKNEREVVLLTVMDKDVHLPARKMMSLVPSKISLMPEQQLRDLTPQQAADLLEFLASLK